MVYHIWYITYGVYIQGSQILVPRRKISGIPETMACRIPVFMWSLVALLTASLQSC